MKNILDEVHANVVQEELLKARNKSSEAAQMRAQQSVVEVNYGLYNFYMYNLIRISDRNLRTLLSVCVRVSVCLSVNAIINSTTISC